MKSVKSLILVTLVLFFSAATAIAHFGMLIPSDNMISQDSSRKIGLQLSFSHPFELVGMEMVKPIRFFVINDEKKTSLIDQLQEIKVMNEPAFKTIFGIKRPGAYVFMMEPEPYWEPAEDCFIIHYTKTIVAAYGDGDGWDTPAGTVTEIIPLTRPFGLYAGNVFQGMVLVDGKPVPGVDVEVEFYNRDNKAKAKNDYMVAQTIKTDPNGVFTYSAPVAGWWGFAALTTSKEKMMYKNQPKDIELGAVIWVKFDSWQEK